MLSKHDASSSICHSAVVLRCVTLANVTLFDDEAFTEPVTLANVTHRKTTAEWQLLDDASCFDNNADVPPPKSAEGFIKF